MKYLSFNQFLKSKFGQRVQKISLDPGLGCPNRAKDKSGGCIFCNLKGSGTGLSFKGIDIKEQIEIGISWAKRRYKAKKFIAYFQAYSNTYGDLSTLEKIYRPVLEFPDIVGVSIGTRPDCISSEVLELIKTLFDKKMVWMEYGLQSSSNKTLSLINRGHNVEDFINAVELTKKYPFLICTHVIFGLPGESEKEMFDTIRLVSALKIDGIKFHELYVVRDTKLHEMFQKGKYHPISQKEYAKLVARSIKMLPLNTVIQRLTGDPAKDELVAPTWAKDKQKTIELISKFL